jgi:UDP-N-acetyl-D-glucosamine dehydrogenase
MSHQEKKGMSQSPLQTIGVIGLGYVGLPLIREFIKQGFSVIGFDIDEYKINKLNVGESYIKHIPSAMIKEWNTSGRFKATLDFNLLQTVNSILICVPTPLSEHKEPDLSFVVDTVEVISSNLQKGQLVVLESTTYPGTTDEVMLPILEKSGLKAGRDFYLAFSPEREDPGNKDFSTAKIPKVVGGYTEKCLEKAVELYQAIVTVIPVSSTKVAEAAKILENTYRAVNIALVNELKMLFDKMNIDVREVIDAAATKPFGYHPFYPGPGLGGHCIPIDPFYLTWKAKEYDFSTRFIELAGEINSFQPYYVVEKLMEVLNQKKQAINGAKLLLLGVAYKKDVDDLRESPVLKVMHILKTKGANFEYYDPYVPTAGPFRDYPELTLKSIVYSKEKIKEYDLVMLLTDHSNLPYDEILESAKLILDTRNAFKNHKKVFRA